MNTLSKYISQYIFIFFCTPLTIFPAQELPMNSDSRMSESFELLPLNEEIESFLEMLNQFFNDIDNSKDADNKVVILEFLDRYQSFKDKIKFFKEKIQQSSNPEILNQLSSLESINKKLNTIINSTEMPWAKGKVIFEQLSPEFIESYKNYTNDKYLNDIVNLIWYFYFLAAIKGKTFEEGTFLINSKKTNFIFDFLNSYPLKYVRISSHYPEMAMQQFGIDIPELLRSNLSFPPFMKFHILFAKISQEEIFIKPEDHGVGNINDIIHHSISYIHSLHRRFIGSESAESRKERIPEYISKSWKNLIKIILAETKSGLPADFPKIDQDLIKFYEQFGIRGMIRFATSAFLQDEILTPQQLNAKNLFMQELQKFGDLYLRRGNEVIITDDDFEYELKQEQLNIMHAKEKLESEFKEKELSEIEKFEQELKEKENALRTLREQKLKEKLEELEIELINKEADLRRQKKQELQERIKRIEAEFEKKELEEEEYLQNKLKNNELQRQEIEKFDSFKKRNLKLFIENNNLSESYEGFIKQYLTAFDNQKFKLAKHILNIINEIAYTKEGYANKYEFIKQYLYKYGFSVKEIFEKLDSL